MFLPVPRKGSGIFSGTLLSGPGWKVMIFSFFICPVYLHLFQKRTKVPFCVSAPIVNAEASLGGAVASQSILREENRKSPQAHPSSLGAGKLIRAPLGSFETLPRSPTLSQPLTPGKSLAPEITLVKILFGLKN